ncbi:MAG TPA: 16S rRNA (guanine(966)-N(2))-methyltransferase RsmD [Pseudonocardiaceae bacterium]
MTRIVAGSLGGRRITVPPRGTRPTSERVREAMFSAVEARMELAGARVLDCYAGSGALGIEAISRGAGHVLFVESSRTAAAVLSRNLRALGGGVGEVRATPVEALAALPAPAGYDLVLADPPYALADESLTGVLASLAGNGWLAAGALLVVERPARTAEPAWPAGVEPITTRRYGDTLVCYGRRP